MFRITRFAALLIVALIPFACGEDTPLTPSPPSLPDPLYFALQQGVSEGWLLGWCGLSTPLESTSASWEAECFIPGHPFQQSLFVERRRGRGTDLLSWRLGPDAAGPHREGSIGREAGWDYRLAGWGDLAIARELLPADADPLILSIHSALGAAELGLRWAAAGRPAALDLDLIIIHDPAAAPLPRTGLLQYEGPVTDAGVPTESFRLTMTEGEVFIKLMRNHFPAPFKVWWAEFNLYIYRWGDGQLPPDLSAYAFAPQWPEPDAYTVEAADLPAGDLLLGHDRFLPEGAGPFPAVLILADTALADRDDAAAGRHLAHHLAKAGWLVHRHDKPGTGTATGDVDSLDLDGRRRAIDAAWTALRDDPQADLDRCYLIGHGEGAALALEFAAAETEVAGLLALAPPLYDSALLPSIPEAEGAGDWIQVLDLDCFTGKHRDLLAFDSEDHLRAPAWSGRPVGLFRAEDDPRLSEADMAQQAAWLEEAGALVDTQSFADLGPFLSTDRADQAPPYSFIQAILDWLEDAGGGAGP